MYACVKMSGVPVSHTDTSPHAIRGCRRTHTHTHVSVHRPAHLCRTPPCCSILRQSFCSSSVVLLGVGVLFVVLVRGARERDRWRGGVKRRRKSEVAGWSSAGQGHCVDDLLQLAPQSLSPRLFVPLQRRQDLILVLDNVGVDLM